MTQANNMRPCLSAETIVCPSFLGPTTARFSIPFPGKPPKFLTLTSRSDSNVKFRPFLPCSCEPDGSISMQEGRADGDEESRDTAGFSDLEAESVSGDGVYIEISRTGKNSRKILSRIGIDATLETIWDILTDYDRLAEFIPGLAVSQLMEKGDNFARLLQIGEQEVAFGLKFNAKLVVDCFEMELDNMPSGQKRDIEFKMIEGDFQMFEGKWSIEQMHGEGGGEAVNESNLKGDGEFMSILSYVVNVKPKLWLPVQLVEGRLCKEMKANLISIRQEADKASRRSAPSIHSTTQ